MDLLAGNSVSSNIFCVCAQSLSLACFFVPHGLWLASLLCPWNFPCKNTRAGYHILLQGIFPIQWPAGWSRDPFLHLLHWQVGCLPLSHMESLKYCLYTLKVSLFCYFFLKWIIVILSCYWGEPVSDLLHLFIVVWLSAFKNYHCFNMYCSTLFISKF